MNENNFNMDCWAFFVTNLKSVIEYGNDLRETTADSEELVNR